MTKHRPTPEKRPHKAPESPKEPMKAKAAPQVPEAPDAAPSGLIRDQLPPDPGAHLVTPIEADVAAETVRLEFLRLRPEVNSWLIELSEKRLATLRPPHQKDRHG